MTLKHQLDRLLHILHHFFTGAQPQPCCLSFSLPLRWLSSIILHICMPLVMHNSITRGCSLHRNFVNIKCSDETLRRKPTYIRYRGMTPNEVVELFVNSAEGIDEQPCYAQFDAGSALRVRLPRKDRKFATGTGRQHWAELQTLVISKDIESTELLLHLVPGIALKCFRCKTIRHPAD